MQWRENNDFNTNSNFYYYLHGNHWYDDNKVFAFILFKGTKSNNSYINYLGQVLPYSAIGLLVVYCLKNVSFKSPTYGITEAVAILFIVVLHYWKGNTLLSIGVGTIIYMALIQAVFV